VHDVYVMLQFISETLPFVVFAAIGILVLADVDVRPVPVKGNTLRSKRFCGYVDGDGLVLIDPDGKVVPHRPIK
jgi:hypothetical protein